MPSHSYRRAITDFQDIRPGVKVVKIDGRLPGAAGYPLR